MSSRPHRTTSGFTLLEIMVAVVIIGLLATLSIPIFTQLRERSVRTVMANELRLAAAALNNYAFEKGDWPPDGAGGWPTEIIDYLPQSERWNGPTPIGGKWAWVREADALSASIQVNDFTAPLDQIASLDRVIDNGELSTGNLRVVGTSLVYLFE